MARRRNRPAEAASPDCPMLARGVASVRPATGAAMATKAARPRFEFRLTRERLFYSGMALLIFVLVVIGFAPTWFLRGVAPAARPLIPMSPLVMLHGTLFTAWIALFVTQAGLISARRHKLHMKLGLATVGLGAAMVVVGLLTAAGQVGRGTSPPDLPPLSFFAIPFLDMVVFASLLAGGYATRRDPQSHKRLMLCATALMLQPGVGRMDFMPMFLGAETTAILAFVLATPLLAWDFVQRGRPHRATLIGLGLLGGEQVVRLAIWRTEAWTSLAGWIVRTLG